MNPIHHLERSLQYLNSVPANLANGPPKIWPIAGAGMVLTI